IVLGEKLIGTTWPTAIAQAAQQLKQFSGQEIAIIASGRMTNEELWLTLQLARTLDVELIDIVPRTGAGDDILLSEDRNPNTNRAVRGPGEARDDWEILRDLIQACAGQNSIYSIEDVFRQMVEAVPQLAGLSLSKIGDLGIQVMEAHESRPPPVDAAAAAIEKA